MNEMNEKPPEVKQEVLDKLHEAGNAFNEAMNAWQNSANTFWTGLEPEEQLMAFCAVIERLHKGECEEGRSYRGILYDTFGWGPEAYATAQCAGFLDLHNSIYRFDDLLVVFKNTLKELEIEVEDEKLSDALVKYFY
jgi:hypothetical protein